MCVTFTTMDGRFIDLTPGIDCIPDLSARRLEIVVRVPPVAPETLAALTPNSHGVLSVDGDGRTSMRMVNVIGIGSTGAEDAIAVLLERVA